jgi:hypothetical protein
MDPYTQGAYGQIQLFLANLTLVLGSLLGATPYGSSGRHLPLFNQIGFPQQINSGCNPCGTVQPIDLVRGRTKIRDGNLTLFNQPVAPHPFIQKSQTINIQKFRFSLDLKSKSPSQKIFS